MYILDSCHHPRHFSMPSTGTATVMIQGSNQKIIPLNSWWGTPCVGFLLSRLCLQFSKLLITIPMILSSQSCTTSRQSPVSAHYGLLMALCHDNFRSLLSAYFYECFDYGLLHVYRLSLVWSLPVCQLSDHYPPSHFFLLSICDRYQLSECIMND